MSTEPEKGRSADRGSIPADSFGNRLMLARAHAGHISIREAADLCGLGRGAWTNWERGTRPVDIIRVATVIADRLGVDRDWLLFGGALPPPEERPFRQPAADRVAAREAATHRPTPTSPRPHPRPKPTRATSSDALVA